MKQLVGRRFDSPDVQKGMKSYSILLSQLNAWLLHFLGTYVTIADWYTLFSQLVLNQNRIISNESLGNVLTSSFRIEILYRLMLLWISCVPNHLWQQYVLLIRCYLQRWLYNIRPPFLRISLLLISCFLFFVFLTWCFRAFKSTI
jgi:hypothetical protein